MRKIIVSTFATLDGFIDDPHLWSLRYADEESGKYGLDLALSADALLLGRVTWEGMAQAWPGMGGNPYGDHVNAVTKYVVASRPVDTSAWNPTVVIPGGDLIPEVTKLKQQDGGNILIWGNGRLTDALAAAGLLDEYHVWVYPVIKGEGEPLFRKESAGTLELLGATTFPSGALVLTYRPLTSPPA
ncbi:pyrimidine reductase [Sphaerisporangium krabiense]|uniref:Dihydrofolate reductase n=1 Tax=Sphaerisporangium krabiense TaxID=763782 RepID=A0A7W8ZCW8_9ACTN|nr:dihydrofolate reductase family protein [Sphaerisporangium krabiense]MBB5631713.1 dihydrofolate reductase [Sphaerisporangium krabiense]GII60650.1 pyrimidine reductase [Sphaerisporangium krabiense]